MMRGWFERNVLLIRMVRRKKTDSKNVPKNQIKQKGQNQHFARLLQKISKNAFNKSTENADILLIYYSNFPLRCRQKNLSDQQPGFC